MKISAAALLFLILAAALGPPTHGSPVQALGVEIHEWDQSMILHSGVRHPSDCCLSYTSRNIRCGNMEDYYKTSSRCSKPAVIFITKRGKRVCANPGDGRVQRCMEELDSAKFTRKMVG